MTTSFQYDEQNRLLSVGSQGPQGAVASYAYDFEIHHGYMKYEYVGDGNREAK